MTQTSEFEQRKIAFATERLEKVKGCLRTLYMRYRRNVPDDDALDFEAKITSKDLVGIPNDELVKAFNLAHELHDKTSIMPTIKDILKAWRQSANQSPLRVINSACARCLSDGLVRLVNKKGHLMQETCMRCSCPNGDRWPHWVMQYSEERRKEGWMTLGERDQFRKLVLEAEARAVQEKVEKQEKEIEKEFGPEPVFDEPEPEDWA